MTLTRLCSPLSSGHARYDTAITRYFQQRRIVANHQIIAIPLTSHNTHINATWSHKPTHETHDEPEVEEGQEEQREEEEEQDRIVRDVRARLRSLSPVVVFFRVSSLSTLPYLCIEPGVTSISTEGSINASAPHQLARYLTHSLSRSSTVPLTALLTRQRAELYELIAPAVSGTGGTGGFALLVKASAHAMADDSVQSVASALGVHYLPLSLFTLLASPAFLPLSSSTSTAIPTAPTAAYSSVLAFITSCRPCLVHVRHLSALSAAKDSEKHVHAFLDSLISSSAQSIDDSVIVVGECEDDESVSVGVRGLFTHTYSVDAPNRDEREQILLAALADEQNIGVVDADDRAEMARVMAGKSAGVSVGELVGVVREGVRLGRRRWMEDEQQRRHSLQNHNLRQSTSSASPPTALALPSLPLILEPFTLTLPDLLSSLSAYTSRTSVLAGTLATLPTTRWSDIGGLTAAKRQIQQMIDLPRLSALTQSSNNNDNSSKNNNKKPHKTLKINGGILLFGPPGTGKCFARGTRLRLLNGETIAVERVKGGEQLMGDDGQPRTVTLGTVIQGSDTLYRISPIWDGALPFTVNGAHILVLSNSTTPRVQKRTWQTRTGVQTRWQVIEWELTTDNRMVEADRGSCDTKELAEAELDRVLAAGWAPIEWEVSVEEFLRASAEARNCCKLIACNSITFNNPLLSRLPAVLTVVLKGTPSAAQVEYMAWWLGMWVTDGVSASATVCHGGAPPPDSRHHRQIFARLLDYQRLFNEPVMQVYQHTSTAGWPVYMSTYGISSVAGRVLQSYGLINNKHVPRALICDSIDVRRHFLAGLIDGGGYYRVRNNDYEIQAKHRHVIDSCKELAATLGLRNSAVQLNGCTNQQTGEVYRGHRVIISGHMWDVVQHCAATYKQCPQPGTPGYAKESQDTRCYGFNITELDEGDYFGFAVHGGINRRFLLEDYTVTHNVSERRPHLPTSHAASAEHLHRLTVCTCVSALCCCIPDADGQGGGGREWHELYECEGPRAAQHVRGRERAQRAQRVCACTSVCTVCDLLRRAGLAGTASWWRQ